MLIDQTLRYLHTYVWWSLTKLPNLNPLIFWQWHFSPTTKFNSRQYFWLYGKVRQGNFNKNFKLSGPLPPINRQHSQCLRVGYSCYPPCNMTQQSLPKVPFFVAGDGNGHPIQKSADGAIPMIAYKVRVWSAIPPRYALTRTARIVFASLYHVNYIKM